MLGSIGDVGTYSFKCSRPDVGDGGMVVTKTPRPTVAALPSTIRDTSPLRTGVEVGHRPFVGLDFRMTEIAAAVVLAQLGNWRTIRRRLHANKARLKAGIADFPG